MAQGNRSQVSSRVKLIVLIQANLLLVALTLSFQLISCEPKEFDWSELGVSLGGPKSTYNGSNNNLRILLSPQRRMTSKSYEIDYSNSSHPTLGEASYVIPGSGSTGYAAQPSAHNSAYSALSASLATLKNRLNARGALGAQLSEVNSQSSGLYQNSAGSYGSPLSSDSHQQQVAQQQQQQHIGAQNQAQSQPTYLSVSHQDQQSSGYGAVQNQSSDNKTIVLAIPAKINFLTDGRSSSSSTSKQQLQPQQLTQQPQQVTVIQTNDQATRPEYASSGSVQDGMSLEQATGTGAGSDQQDHHQYVIVNSPHTSSSSASSPGHPNNEHITHYQNVYQPTVQQAPVTVKYIPSYQPVTAVQPKTIYAPIEHQTNAYSDAQPANDLQMYGRYSCLDTCNSGDIRWRKYTVSKYKYCCSRSAQYDPQFETPSAEKLGESAKQADDAYYNYLYRRTRARRSRRPSQRYHTQYPRYNRYASSSTASVSSSDDDTSSNEGRSRLYESPYMKYYKSRQAQQHESPETTRDVHDSSVTVANGKYGSKEKSYRRGRARDFDSQEQSQPSYENGDEENSYPEQQPSRSVGASYGNADYSADTGRHSSSAGVDDDEARSGYPDESPDTEVSGKGTDGSTDYPNDSALDHQQNDDGNEQDSVPTYKYSANRRRKTSKSRQRKLKHGKQESKSHQSKKNGRKLKHGKQDQMSSQINGTDYESSSGNNQSNSEQYRNAESSTNEDEPSTGGESGGEGEGEKDSLSLTNKFKSALNESTVVNLSKTTMHLKEILSMLEKKAHLRLNDTSSNDQSNQQQQSSSTPSPIPMTTTNLYPYSFLGSQFNSPSLQALSSEYLTSELNLKSPYRFETSPHLASSLTLPSTYNAGLGLDAYSTLSNHYGANHFPALATQKQHATYGVAGHQPQRKRRINKNVRYNNLMVPKVHGLGVQSSLAHYPGTNKYPFLNGGYYSTYYPYWYSRNTSPTITNAYPYRNKNSYSSLLSGPVSSKLAAAASGALHNEESRVHGSSNFDPISNVASSLRPTSTMRLRKPLYQPHLLPPIYTRLTQPLDSTK